MSDDFTLTEAEKIMLADFRVPDGVKAVATAGMRDELTYQLRKAMTNGVGRISTDEERVILEHRAEAALREKPIATKKAALHAQCAIVELVRFGQTANPECATWTHLLDMLKANKWTE